MAEKQQDVKIETVQEEKLFDTVSQIIAYEQGDLSAEGIVDLFAELIRTGLAWMLQECYGRVARNLIVNGFIDRDGVVLKYPED